MSITAAEGAARTKDSSAAFHLEVPVDKIERDPTNRIPTAEDVAARANSIEAVGLLQPIVLRATGNGRYRLMAGETRWLAFQKLKRKSIPARIFNDQSEIDAAKKALVENAQRADLTPIQRAKRFKQLTELKLGQKEIGVLAGGLSQPVVANALRLLELPTEVQDMVDKGELTEAHGVVLVKWAKWPRLCACIARNVARNKDSAKWVAEQQLPYHDQLERAKLVVEINTGNSWSSKPLYKLPSEFKALPEVIAGSHDSWYILPEDPKAPNKWEPVREQLDAARKVEEKAAEEREEATQSKLSPAEKKKRAKKIADNKRNRAESAERMEVAFEQLRSMKSIDRRLLLIAASKVLHDSHYGNVVSEAAEKIGVKLPKGLVMNSWYTSVSFDKLHELRDTDLLRVSVAAVVMYHGQQAVKFAHEVPDEISTVAGKAKATPKPTTVEVTVKESSSNNVARAGSSTASCTASAVAAAREAAAKHLGCSKADVDLKFKRAGVYVASRKGRQ